MQPDQVERMLRLAVFRNLAHDRLRAHLEPLAVRSYAAGETVAEPNLRRMALQVVLNGRLRLFEVTPGGRRIILDHVEAGGVDGLLAVAGLRGHLTEALVDSDVVTISRPAFEGMVREEPHLAMNLLWIMSRRLRRREDQLARLTLRDPGQRLAAQLLALSETADDRHPRDASSPRFSHETLADLLGLRRETVTLHLARLRRMDAVRVQDHCFRLNVRLLEAIRDGEVPVGA